MNKYIRFGLMILTSTVVMYFLMFVNVSEFAHIYLSQTRVYMAILMGAIMAIIMMGFMWKMYDNKKIKYRHNGTFGFTRGGIVWAYSKPSWRR